MAKFLLQDAHVTAMSDKFGLSRGLIKSMYETYASNIDDLLDKQYFAHTIRAVEQYVINSQKALASFYIRCVEDDSFGKHPSYFLKESEDKPDEPKKIKYFIMHFPAAFDPQEKRMAIAHELGHLFINVSEKIGAYNDEEIKGMESWVNVFGLLLIFGRKAADLSDAFEQAGLYDIINKFRKFCEDHEIKGDGVG